MGEEGGKKGDGPKDLFEKPSIGGGGGGGGGRIAHW